MKYYLNINMDLAKGLTIGFTPCKAQQPLQGMELQEKEAKKD